MLQPHILKILNGSPASGIIVAVLKIELSARMRRPVGELELREALTAMKDSGWLTEKEAKYTRDPEVALTTAGKKEARKL